MAKHKKQVEGKETVEFFQELDRETLKTEKFLERKTRAISRTGLFWSEKLAQSAATEVFRPVVRRRQSAILWVIRSLRLSDQKRLDEGQPSAFARRLCR